MFSSGSRSRNFCATLIGERAASARPAFCAARSTFWPCSSVPVRKNTSSPISRCARATASATMRRVGVAEMRLRVDVVDRRGDVEAAHDAVTRPAAPSRPAPALPSPDRLFAAASFAQSSNSGTALTTRPSRQASLNRTAPTGVSTLTISRCRHSRSTSRVPQADRRRLAEDDVGQRARARSGGATTVSSVPGPVLLHLHRRRRTPRARPPRTADPWRRRRAAGSCRRSRTR